jgi:hypothetical protein
MATIAAGTWSAAVVFVCGAFFGLRGLGQVRPKHRVSRNGSALAGRDQGQPQAGATPPVSFGLKGGRPRPGKCSGNIRFAQCRQGFPLRVRSGFAGNGCGLRWSLPRPPCRQPRHSHPKSVPGDSITPRIRLRRAPDKNILITPAVETVEKVPFQKHMVWKWEKTTEKHLVFGHFGQRFGDF